MSEFWLGTACDHLYAGCPILARSLPILHRYRLDRKGAGTVDPAGPGICGWCRRVWAARRKETR